jgi:hypothetical protein
VQPESAMSGEDGRRADTAPNKEGGDVLTGIDGQVKQVSEGEVRQISAGQKGEAAKREGPPESQPCGYPRAHMFCCSAHGRRESLVAGHSATLDAIVVVVPTMQAAVVGTRTKFRGAILLCSIYMLHGKCMLGVADV